ncbi:MAG: DNA translocase FtsK [Geminicoccaceae bacterium]
MAAPSLSRRERFDFGEFLARRMLEALGIGLCLIALFLAVALWGFDARDPSLNLASSAVINNPLGRFGANVSDFAFQTVGVAAWLVALVFFIWGIRLILDRGSSWAWISVLSLPPALIALAAYLATFNVPDPEAWPYRVGLGGIVGDFSLFHLQPAIGGQYSLYAAITASVLAIVAIGISMGEAAEGVGRLFGRTRGHDRSRRTPGRPAAKSSNSRQNAAARGEPSRPVALRVLGGLAGLIASPLISLFRRRDAEASNLRGRPSRGIAGIQRARGSKANRDQQRQQAEDEERDEAPASTAKPGKTSSGSSDDLTPADKFELPPLKFLAQPKRRDRVTIDETEAAETAKALEKVLDDFGVRGEIVAVKPGPVITLYELEPAPGTRAARVIALADDIARSLCAMSVRVAVVPGRNVIGIELPNDHRETVYLSDLLSSEAYEKTSSGLGLALGKDISGEPVIVDLARMPHLLIAGTTGSGKSVAINAMILSLLYRMPPSACKLIMIDPKVIELSVYDGIPHLLAPVVTEPHKAVVALKWIVREMDDRYRLMSHLGVRDIFAYNRRISEAISRGEQLSRKVQTGFEPGTGVPIFEQQPIKMETLPLIVVIVDEVADLMLTAGKEIEGCIQRLSQKARAAGVHLIVATQRPSVDVLTGVIKANLPARISFRVSSKIDSRTILGEPGAEQLLGQGDMLQMMAGDRTTRIHGPLVTDEEVERVVTYLKSQGSPSYIDAVTNEATLDNSDSGDDEGGGSNIEINNGEDAQYAQALQIVAKEGRASTSFLQRKLRIGYNSAARLIERMEQDGHVSSPDHVGRRKVLMGGGDEDGPSGVDAPW